MASLRRPPRIAAFVALAIVLAGCSDDSSKTLPTGPVPDAQLERGAPRGRAPTAIPRTPVPDSPVHVVQLLGWGLEHRDLAVVSSVFTANLFFLCGTDSAGYIVGSVVEP